MSSRKLADAGRTWRQAALHAAPARPFSNARRVVGCVSAAQLPCRTQAMARSSAAPRGMLPSSSTCPNNFRNGSGSYMCNGCRPSHSTTCMHSAELSAISLSMSPHPSHTYATSHVHITIHIACTSHTHRIHVRPTHHSYTSSCTSTSSCAYPEPWRTAPPGWADTQAPPQRGSPLAAPLSARRHSARRRCQR